MLDVHVPSSEELAEAIRAEVLQCVRDGVIPANVGSFSDLHDYCDANCLGGTEELLDRMDAALGAEPGMAAFCDLMNEAIAIVDVWIRTGGLTDATIRLRDDSQIP